MTVLVIRPCSGIFGYGDRFLTQQPLEAGFSLGIKPRIKLDYVYVDNIAYAHVLAEARLKDSRDLVSGQVFCVTNRDPITSDEFNLTLKEYAPWIKLYYGPELMLFLTAYLVENLMWLFPRAKFGELENLTPAMLNTCLSYAFNDEKAANLLKYQPVYSVEQALAKTVMEHQQQTILPKLDQ
eukprot:TRINITY_DN25178_c0_g1_i1.p1 TRINITY_DN25178_c0_g1~~TRINITY_DN25178_c0_g1_i1.p1  ORF type:complete len:182 (+),score=50.47 TRINITY_DN25178_c0_g1_i1:322-867(+)